MQRTTGGPAPLVIEQVVTGLPLETLELAEERSLALMGL